MKPRFFSHQLFMIFVKFRNSLLYLRTAYYRIFYGMDIANDVRISFKARLDKTNPKGLMVDSKSYIAFDSIILSHDFSTRRHSMTTKIGKCCFIGCGSIILPGVNIGDHVIVGAGSVVTKNVPPCSIVAGNPAKVIKSNIMTTDYGMLESS